MSDRFRSSQVRSSQVGYRLGYYIGNGYFRLGVVRIFTYLFVFVCFLLIYVPTYLSVLLSILFID
jgi:hypothetical protein